MKLYDNNQADKFIEYASSNDALFHYTKRAIALEKILYEETFKISRFTNTNDPYEYKDKLIGAVGYGWDATVEEKGRETRKILRKIFTEQTLFISCCANSFKENALTNHGFLKSRMWSQYGENHEGICFLFSKEQLSKCLQSNFIHTEYLVWKGDVKYKEYLKNDLLNINHDTFDGNSPENVAYEYIEKNHRTLLFRKQCDYMDEQEYRIVILRKDAHMSPSAEAELEVKHFLKGIILGDRFPEVYKPAIESICIRMNISYRKLCWTKGKYILLSMKQS